MTKKVFILLLSALMGVAQAQTSMTVPYGSFEQWTSHPGYDISAVFLTMPMYNSFSTPTGWDYLSYPVNESLSLGFQTIAVNTMLPLIVASQETGAVPDGNSAVKIQTFMLTDIINSTVYSLASGLIDTALANTVYPSILSTGVVDIDHFIPIMTSLMANMDSAATMLASLAEIDVNYLITGGLALDGFAPTSLTGSYKYHSAVGGDNGGVLMLGTHYNSTLHKREVVGGGVNIALTDCADYTPFTVEYKSLHEYDASYAEQTPDSLIIMLVSSANLNRQQGSYLCVDSLALWHVDPPVPPEPPAPDTCAHITAIVLDSAAITLTDDQQVVGYVASWQSSFDPQGWEVEYGLEGFATGTGISTTVQLPTLALEPLQPESLYELRVRSLCNDTLYGDWETLLFQTMDTTFTITAITAPFSNSQFSFFPNPAHGQCVVNLSEEAELRLYTPNGRLVHTATCHGAPFTLQLPSPGVFLLQIITPDGTLSKKIINR